MKKVKQISITTTTKIEKTLHLITWMTFLFLVVASMTCTKVSPTESNGKIIYMTDSELFGVRNCINGERVIFVPSKNDCKNDLEVILKNHGKTWDKSMVSYCSNVLYLCEKDLKIPHENILAIMATESDMTINVSSKVHDDKSQDHGITQQNSRYINERYNAAASFLKKRNVWFDRNNIYDLGLNATACALYLSELQSQFVVDANSYSKTIKGYNVGANGSKAGKGKEYFERFIMKKRLIYACR